MKNTLSDLNNYLFEAIERINDDDLSDEELDKEIKRSELLKQLLIKETWHCRRRNTLTNMEAEKMWKSHCLELQTNE